MTSKFFPERNTTFTALPNFSGVKIAVFITGRDTDTVSVCELIIAPGIAIPIHAHEPQVDSIYIVSGNGEEYVNSEMLFLETTSFPARGVEHATRNTGRETLVILVHHSPPLL